jgi:predicted PurR-regulated permease PerM
VIDAFSSSLSMEVSPSFRKSPLFTLAAVTLVLWGMHAAAEFCIPVMLAALLAFLMAPVTRILHRWKLPEWACVVVAAVLIILPLAGISYLAIDQIQSLIQNWPNLSSSLVRTLREFRQSPLADRFHLTGALSSASLESKIQNHFGSALLIALTSLKTLFSAGALLVLTLFFALAMLGSKKHLNRSFRLLLSTYTSIESRDTGRTMANMMESFLVARTTIAAGMGLICFLVLLGFGIPYSFLLGVFLGAMTWVPIVGYFVGIAPALVVAFASGTSSGAMVGAFAIITAIWLLQDHVITPKWVGHKIQLNFLATYLAFFAGGLLWGAWGMILSIPLLGLIRIACESSPKLKAWAFLLGERDDQASPLSSKALPRSVRGKAA